MDFVFQRAESQKTLDTSESIDDTMKYRQVYINPAAERTIDWNYITNYPVVFYETNV